ncbi:MAG: chemotaxis protein CheC [Nitrospiria bacterium]
MKSETVIDKPEETGFSEEEKGVLQEVMNISFGRAAADLGKVIDIFVVLSIPNIQLMRGKDLFNYLIKEQKIAVPFHTIEQSFSGRMAGHAVLVLPFESGEKLSRLFDLGEDASEGEASQLTNEATLLEIANILTGACIGKFVELLKDIVTYSPPRLNTEHFPEGEVMRKLVDPESRVISISANFRFESQDIDGFLFLVTDQQSFLWLKKALHNFMEDFF